MQENIFDLPISLAAVHDLINESYDRYDFRIGDVEFILVEFGEFQVVVPRGTEFSGFFTESGYRDVWNDILFFPTYSKRLGGFSHRGFLKSARKIVDKALHGMLRKDKKTLFIGHSYGGGVCVNAGFMMHSMGFNIAGIITVGCPRTLTKGTMNKLSDVDIPVWQFSNPGDPIPDLPFRWWGFRHINEIPTSREADGYSIRNNHMLPHYAEWIYG